MAQTHIDEVRRLLLDQRDLLEQADHGQDLAALNAAYVARRSEIKAQLAVIHVDDPFHWETVWHWIGECSSRDLDAAGRAETLAGVVDPFLAVLNGPGVGPAPYELELYERDGNPDDAPLSRFAFSKLSETKRAALLAALERVLAYQGTNVVSTGWGKNLGGGLYEFKIRKDANEIAALFPDHPGKTAVSSGLPPEDVKLRVFFTARGKNLLLVLSGYDKGEDDNEKRQQEEIKEARKYLREHDERQKRSK